MRAVTIALCTIHGLASAISRYGQTGTAATATSFALKRCKTVGAIIALAGALGVSATADAASPGCGPRTELLRQLAKQFKEAPAAVGLVNSGALVEVLTSGDGATWTILISRPDGTSCLVAAGQEWQALKRVATHEFGI
jgi:hypothetical protein